MDNEWEQEVYIDPSVEEVRQQNRVMGPRWEAARKREIVLVVGIVLTFIARFLKLYLDADVFITNIVFFLNVAGLVLYIIDLAVLMKMADVAEKVFLVLNWLFLRPFYFVRRAGVLSDNAAMKRGVVYGSVYFLAWVIYFGAFLQMDISEMIQMVGVCIFIVLWVVYALITKPSGLRPVRIMDEVPQKVKELLSNPQNFRKIDEKEREQYKSSPWKYGLGIYLFLVLCMAVTTISDARSEMMPMFFVWMLLFGLAIAVLVIRDTPKISSKKELYVIKAYCIYQRIYARTGYAFLAYYNFITAQYEVGKIRVDTNIFSHKKYINTGAIGEVLVTKKKNKLKLIDVV